MGKRKSIGPGPADTSRRFVRCGDIRVLNMAFLVVGAVANAFLRIRTRCSVLFGYQRIAVREGSSVIRFDDVFIKRSFI